MESELIQNSSPSRIKRFIKESSKNGLLIFSGIILLTVSFVAFGMFTQNDNTGFFLVDFNGNQDGIVSASETDLRQNIDVDVVAGVAKLSDGASSGFFTTSEIRPASFSQWDSIRVVAPVFSAIQNITGSLYTCDATPVAIPGYQNMQFAGTNLLVNINTLSTTTYPCVRVRVDMINATGNPGLTPLLDSIRVSWNPEPLFLVSVNTPTSIPAGSVYSATVSYSNSFVDSNGVVVWMELPTYLNGTITNFTSSYNQNPQTTFASASNGGVYTAGGLTLNGVNIPPNSVYWNLGTVVAGRAGTLVARINTGSGWQNGMVLSHTGHIQSSTGQEVISDASSSVPGEQTTDLAIVSAPSPGLQKSASGVAKVNGVNYVVNAPPLTPTVTYSLILSNQSASPGRETIFNPVIVDDISDIVNQLTTSCGVANPIGTNIVINNNGQYNATTQEITWSASLGSFSNIPPSGTANVTYTVNYANCTNGVFDNTASATGDNFSTVTDSESVTVGIDTTPTGSVAKGDKIGASQSIVAGNDDNKYVQQTYGDIFSYLLYAQNSGAVAIGGVVIPDKISASHNFVSASLPATVIGGQVYYNTGGSGNLPTVPPAYSVGGSGITGAGWTTTPPATPSDVKWVAFYVPCLNSIYFPAPAGNTSCFNQPTSVTGTITVQIRPVGNVCAVTEIENTGVFNFHQASPDITNSSLVDLGAPITNTDVEQTHAGPSLASFVASSSLNGPTYMQVGTNGTYTFTVNNTGNDNAQNTLLTITIPKSNFNGVTRYLNFVGAVGGNVTTVIDSGFGQIGTVIIDLGNVAPGSFKTASLTLNLPNGALNNSTFEVVGTITAQDDNNCQNITNTVSRETSVESSPSLQAFKTVDERVIPGGDLIHYNINYRNTGSSPSTNTYIIDRIPQKAVFEAAYTTGTDSSGTTFTCTGCTVYFSNNTTNLPSSLTTSDPVTVSMINSYFTPGTQVTPGVWVPNGYPPEEALWVAWRVDNTALTPAMFPATSTTRRVGLTVRNDDNGYISPLVPSPIGTLISNAPGILADGLPQAVDNQVFTTILPDPGLFLDKISDKEFLRAGETFNWLVEYYNDSGNSDTLVNLIDTLPAGVTLTGLYHQWNAAAILNGQSSGEVSIIADPSVSIAGNLINFSPTAYKGGDLLKLEGGTLRLAMIVENTVVSGSVLTNAITGHFENQSGAYDVFANDEVYVENPDLWIRKQPDITDPVAGDEVNYTLIVSNEGEHDAPNVLISDTLEAGLCYVPGSTTIISPGWTLPEPTITGGPCSSSSTTLTWDSVISNSSYPVGTIPGLSGDIFIRYIVEVESSIDPGVSLINGAHIETDIPEDPIYPNDTGVTVTTPLADPFVTKDVQQTVSPGSNADYSITYGNNTKQPLSNSYVIDSLPDYNSDGKSDMKIVSVNGTNSEQFFYHAGPINGTAPTFDLSNPLSLGWQATWSSTTNHIAIVTGALPAYAGPFIISITLEATDPLTDVELPSGIALTNDVQIFLPAGVNDQDYTNNNDSATVVTPGIDLWVEKTGSVEGGFPGVGPGDSMTYTVSFGNQGTVNACNVYITDVLSTTLNEATVVHNAGNLNLTDTAGNPVFPVDQSGSPIFTPVNISFSQNSDGDYRFDLGDSDTCLTPGSTGEFEIYAIVDPSLPDGSVVSNTAVIGEDSVDVEDLLANNTDNSQTVVYRSDLTIDKSGISKGPDNVLGTGDDSPTQTAIGENVHYTLEYNNIGSAPANNSIITETIPTGMCYIDGSITGYPADATVEFSDDNASSYTYTPTGPVDCSVTHFRVVFGSPIYPGSSTGEDLTIGAFGTSTNVVQSSTFGDLVLKLSNTVVPIRFPIFRNMSYADNFLDLKSSDENNLVDLNNDGLDDVSLEGMENMYIYRNTSVAGNVSFDMANPFWSLRYGPVIYEDLDNDGLKDMIHSNPNYTSLEKPFVAKNSSTLTTINFTGGTTITTLPQNTNIHAVEDFNNDGFKDLLFDPNVDPTGNNNPMIVKNISTVGNLVIEDAATYVGGVYPRSDCSPTQFTSSKIDDIDGDGKKDIILFCQDKRLNIYRNLTDTSSSSNPIVFSGASTIYFPLLSNTSFELMDFNDDGQKDIFFAFPNNKIVVMENTSSSGSISFAIRLDYSDPNANPLYNSFRLTDIDGDGFPDISLYAHANYTSFFPAIIRNDTPSSGGTIAFDPIFSLTASAISDGISVEIEDIDNDTKKDFILGTYTGVSIYRNTMLNSSSPLSFAAPVLSPSSPITSSAGVLIADIDSNGKKDFVLSSAGGSPSVIFENTSFPGSIRFGDVISLGTTKAYNNKAVFRDLDGDTKKDLFIRSPFYSWDVDTSAAYKNNSTPGVISFGENVNNGSYVVPVTKSGGGSWQRLQVSHEVFNNTELEYTIYDNTCGGTPLIPTTTIPNQFIDISSLGTISNVCLVVDFGTSSATASPILDGWQMTYTGGPGTQIEFELQVSTLGNAQQTMVNTATIQTDSEEITTDNNSDDYTISMTQADVEITKTVDFSSADPGDTLTYTLNYRNNGPLDAHNVLIDDILPAGVSPISWTQISGTDTVTCSIDYSANSISCTDTSTPDWVLSPNESGSIEIEVTIAGGGVPISLTHTNQSDLDVNDLITNMSTSTVPGSLVPVNSTVALDVNATSIDYIDLYLYDDSWNLIEGTSGSVSDLINFTVTSLSPVTLQYIGPLPMNVNNLYVSMSFSGGNIASYYMNAYDMTGDNIMDYVDGATDSGSFSSWITDPINLSLPFVLQATSPGYSTVSNPGTVVTAPQARYINHFDMPATACPTGNRKWGALSLDIDDPQGNVTVYVSDSASYPLFLANSAPTVDQLFTMYGYLPPVTLYYHVVIDRTDTSYFPQVNEISVETNCEGGVSPGTQLINTATISTSTRDTDVLNNTDNAVTVIGEISNLTVEKSGPTQVSIGNTFTYTIDVENNGNVPAENITLTDVLPSQVNYVSVSSSGAISFSCSNNSGTLSCTGSGSLDSGDIATLSVTVSVPNNIILIGDVLRNVVTVATTTIEVTVVDNIDEYDITIAPLGNSSISGYVYVDANTNNQKDGGEPGIDNVSVFIAGKDIFGNVYGPDKNTEPLVYQAAMDKLVAMSLIPNRPYLATDPYPARYFPINADVTTASGAWIFDNFNPGTYAVFELHPAAYTSTGSNAGYSSTDGLGNPIFDVVRDGIGSFESGLSTDEDLIHTIMLSDNQNAVQYNFGEINGSIGDLVFLDQNLDGIFNGSDTGIAGVQINLFTDINSNGVVDAGEPSSSTTTDSNGNYLFSGLVIGSQYIVQVVDSTGVLGSYNAIVGPNPGVNNNSQNSSGYVVNLISGNSINLTADFGYHQPDTGCVGSGCGGSGCTGPNCNPSGSSGFIGNQVFFDENGNGIFDGGEIGIPGVEITLYIDIDRNGRIGPYDQERTMKTNQYGVYGWGGLSFDYQYMVVVTDADNVLNEFTHILGPNGALDNHSKNELGYLINLTALEPINNTADFGYVGYELPQTGQAVSGKMLFGITLITVTIFTLWFFRRERTLTSVINNLNIKYNGKS